MRVLHFLHFTLQGWFQWILQRDESMSQTPEVPSSLDALLEKVKVVLFDWDGTAVMTREKTDWQLVAVLEQALRCQLCCAVITGTSFENLSQSVLQYLSPYARTQLYVCTNRGAEVYAYDALGNAKRIAYEPSSAEQEAQLDQVAFDLQTQWEKLGLKTNIIMDRLHRRKLDLIPFEEAWKAPRKDQVVELLRAVTSVLDQTQVKRGFSELLERATESAQRFGLNNPQITTDLKHIEVGLSSKRDSVKWVVKNLIHNPHIHQQEVLVIGDEFGALGGVSGSDSLMRLPELAQSLFISVGLEPVGVPPGVLHLGGGPSQFKALLRRLKKKAPQRDELRSREEFKEGSELITWGWSQRDPLWRVQQEGFNPSEETEVETRFTLGNGYLGIRGSSSIPIPSSRGDLFLAGVFDERAKKAILLHPSPVLREGLDEFSEIVIFPSVFYFRLKINGEPFVPGRWERGHEYRRYLSLDTGILSEVFLIRVDSLGTQLSIHTQRLVSAHHVHFLLQEIQFGLSQGEVLIEVDTSLEDPDHELKHPHLKILSMETRRPEFTELHEFETQKSKIRSLFIARTYCQGVPLIEPSFTLKLTSQEPQVIQKLIQVHHSQDFSDPSEGRGFTSQHEVRAISVQEKVSPTQVSEEMKDLQDLQGASSFRLAVLSTLREMDPEFLPALLRDHLEAWKKFWIKADVSFPQHLSWQRSLRFNAYHLRIAAGENPRVSIGARTLSGSAYDGHFFWDTEIFILPFFQFHDPSVVRSCLEYRYRSLPQAQLRAQNMGCQGACFAWESTVTGKDVTPTHIALSDPQKQIPVFTGEEQIHVTADVAHAVSLYWSCTHDLQWMIRFGAEILIETARFWASRTQVVQETYHLFKVMGPDEYHHEVDDNAYTNWMARENLRKALWVCEFLEQAERQEWLRVENRLKISLSERKKWERVAQNLYFPEPNDQGVIEEFQGFFHLSAPHLEREKSFSAPLDRLLHWERVNQFQIVKQADVLMIPFLFPECFTPEVLKANYQYYQPITDHGSSLSLAVYASVAAQLGEWEVCMRDWQSALNLDLENLMKNTALGIHAGCLGGSWQALIFHVLGIRLGVNQLELSPWSRPPLPDVWRGLKAKVTYQSQVYEVIVSMEGQVQLCRINEVSACF